MLSPKDVLPTDGLAPIIIKLPFCNPEVSLSMSLKPVGTPVSPLPCCLSSIASRV